MAKWNVNNRNIKLRLVQFSFFMSALTLSVMFQNCSAVSPSRNNYDESSVSQSSQLTSKAMSIIAAKCAHCHNPENAQGGITEIMNINYLLYYRLVIPGQPDISDVVRVIREGSMPPDNNPVSVDELDSLSKWIQSGIVDESGGVILPGGSAPLQATFASLNSRIFSPRCTGCHNATTARGGVNLSTYAGIRAVAIDGRLYSSVTRPGADFMPQNGVRLTATEELPRLNEWIMAGALNN